MTNLSVHFTLEEFCTSQTAARMGRLIEPTPDDIANLERLCETVLEPLRAALGRPIHISSGLRPSWLNQAIGGSNTSAHMDGRAADIEVPGMTPLEVCERVVALALPIDQCILEFPDSNGWCHVGIADQPRGQLLTAKIVDGRTKYINGFVT